MTKIEIIAQIISICGMTMNVLSFQQKRARGIITFQLFGGVFFCVSYFLLGGIAGALLNIAAVIRAIDSSREFLPSFKALAESLNASPIP